MAYYSREELTEAIQMTMGERDRFALEVAQLEANLETSLAYPDCVRAKGEASSLASPMLLMAAEGNLAHLTTLMNGGTDAEAREALAAARADVEKRHALTQARYDAVEIVNGEWQPDDETLGELGEKYAALGIDWAGLLRQSAQENGLTPEALRELEVPAAVQRLITEEPRKEAPEPQVPKSRQEELIEAMGKRPADEQEERWSNRPPSPATTGLIARLTKEGKIPLPVLAKYRENENQLAAHRLLNVYGPRKFKANQPGKTEQATEQETVPKPRALGHWPNVNFPAKDVTKVVPLINKRTGEAILDRQGQPRYEATVRIPNGVSLDGTDLSGWMFKQAIGAKSAEAKEAGRPVNVSFRPGTKLGLFKYEGEGKARRPVADPPAVDDDDKLQALCSAVARARKEQEAGGGEEPHAPERISRQRARVTAEQPSLFDAAGAPARGVGGGGR